MGQCGGATEQTSIGLAATLSLAVARSGQATSAKACAALGFFDFNHPPPLVIATLEADAVR